MKSLRLITLSVSLFITGFSISQQHWLGAQGGVNFSTMNDQPGEIDINYLTAFNAGLNYQYQLKPSLYLGADLLYTRRGYKATAESIGFTYNEVTGEISYVPVTLELRAAFDYLSLPLKVGYRYGEKIYGFAELGACPAYLMSVRSTVLNNSTGMEESEDVSKEGINSFDLSAVGSIGAGLAVSEKMNIFVKGTYQYSFTRYNESNMFGADYKLRTISFNAGLSYSLF